MKDVGQYTIQRPENRFNQIEGLAKDLNKNSGGGINFEIQTDSNEITGYQLDYPTLEGRHKMNGSDRLRLDGLYKEKDMKYWLFFYDYKHERDTGRIIGNIIKAG